MIKELRKKPNSWLTLRVCITSFNHFREKLHFDQPIPSLQEEHERKLGAILNSVAQTYGGKHLNISILEASSAYLNQLVRGHAFLNGNKRMAVLFTHIFLLMNGVNLNLSFKGFYNLALIVALMAEKGYSSEKTKGFCRHVIQKYSVKSEL